MCSLFKLKYNIKNLILSDIDMSKITDKINLVIGLGRSGYWVAKFLNSKRKRVIVLEEKINDQLAIYKRDLENIGVTVFLGFPFEFEKISQWENNINHVILSPAIDMENQTVLKLKNAGIKVIGEANIGWNYLKEINWVGITGTNGKTTVTHLLSHILSQNKLKAPFAGNIGIPFCKYAYDYNLNKNIDWIIAELSSYQIEIASEIKPKIGIWTTFTPDHLDRHKTLENYFKIKNHLLKSSEIRIYNYDDDYLKSFYKKLAKGTWVSLDYKNKNIKNCDFWLDEKGYIVEKGIILFHSNSLKLKGKHNILNLLLVTAAARKIGITGKNIRNSLKTYKQLPHRLETIYSSKNLEVINDSKATNFDSSFSGISSLDKGQIIIIGGRIKKGNSKLWSDIILEKCKGVFLYGESSKELKSILLKAGFMEDIFIHNELNDLIPKAINYLKKRKLKILLFSPACSSFDQFKDYEERGNYFKLLIKKYL